MPDILLQAIVSNEKKCQHTLEFKMILYILGNKGRWGLLFLEIKVDGDPT